jgi:hypothetical protein
MISSIVVPIVLVVVAIIGTYLRKRARANATIIPFNPSIGGGGMGFSFGGNAMGGFNSGPTPVNFGGSGGVGGGMYGNNTGAMALNQPTFGNANVASNGMGAVNFANPQPIGGNGGFGMGGLGMNSNYPVAQPIGSSSMYPGTAGLGVGASLYPSSAQSYQPVPQSMSDPQSYGVQMTTLGGGGGLGNAGLSSYPYGGGLGSYGNSNTGMNQPMSLGNYNTPMNMNTDYNYQTSNRNEHIL